MQNVMSLKYIGLVCQFQVTTFLWEKGQYLPVAPSRSSGYSSMDFVDYQFHARLSARHI